MELTAPLRRFVHWHRRLIAALLAGLAALLAVSQLTSSEPGVAVVVTTTDLGPGEVLEASDLAVVELPPQALPAGEPMELDALVGRVTAAAVAANSVLQPGLLASGDLVAPGRALVPVALTDERLASLLTPGTRITLTHISEFGFDVLTSDARVGALPPAEAAPPLSAGLSGAPLVLVDVPGEVAAAASVLGQRGELGVILGSA